MNETSLVAQSTVASDENVAGDGLPEDLDLEDVCDDLLGLSIDIRVNESHVVVAGDDISESGETLLDSLDGDGRREGVSEVLELLIGGGVGEEETVSVS